MNTRQIGKERRAREERERIGRLETFKQGALSGGVEIASFTLGDGRLDALLTAEKLGFSLVVRRNWNTGAWRVMAVRQ